MNSLFAPVDTLDTSTYLHSVVYPNNSFALEWLMPVTGVQGNGQPITPPGFDNDYGLYLTIDASGILGQTTPTPIASQFTSINVTLWLTQRMMQGQQVPLWGMALPFLVPHPTTSSWRPAPWCQA